MKFLEYYGGGKLCTIDIFFTKEDGHTAVFLLVLLSSSFIGYWCIAIVYLLIFKNISTSELKSFFRVFLKILHSKNGKMCLKRKQ